MIAMNMLKKDGTINFIPRELKVLPKVRKIIWKSVLTSDGLAASHYTERTRGEEMFYLCWNQK